MLDILRQSGVKNVVYGVVIVVSVAIFAFSYGTNPGEKSAPLTQACTARVKGTCIEVRDLTYGARLMSMSNPQSSMTEAQLKKQAVEGLIERELLVAEAERLGIAAKKDELDDQLFNGLVRMSSPIGDTSNGREVLAVGFRSAKSKQFDLKQYETFVQRQLRLSVDEFREQQTKELLASKMRDIIRAPVRVSEAEAFDAYTRKYNTATLNYVFVPDAFAAKYLVSAKQDEIDAFTKEHQSEVDAEFESRKKDDLPKANTVRHILVKVAAGASDEDKGMALYKLSLANQRIKAGEPFAVVAREVTEDPGAKSSGGAYDEKMVEQFVEPFKKAFANLKPGEMTRGAVQTSFGFHLIERDDPSKAGEVEPRLKKAIAKELFIKSKGPEAAKAFAAKVQSQVAAGKAGEDAVKAALAGIAKPGAAVTPLPVIAPPPAPAADAGEAAAADAGAATAEKKNDDTTKKDDKKKEEPAAPFTPVTADNDPDRPQWRASSPLSAGGDAMSELTPESTTKVMKFAFSAKENELMPEPVQGNDGILVIQLKENHKATREEFEKQKESETASLLSRKQAEALALYLKQLRESAKNEIKINEAMFRTDKDAGAAGPMNPENE